MLLKESMLRIFCQIIYFQEIYLVDYIAGQEKELMENVYTNS